jgi:hypothetical protein
VHKFGKHLRVLETDLLKWQENQLIKNKTALAGAALT